MSPDRRPLRGEGTVWLSTEGAHEYEVRNGIPCFLHYQTVDEGWSEDELDRLTALAQEKGWREAVIEVYGADSSMLRYVDSKERESFLSLLPIDKTSDVLEIGIGFGQFTVPLARRAGQLHALEVRFQQAVFADLRCREEGLSNVLMACGGDDCKLPYSDASMDVVVLNLVFEWCGSRLLDSPGETGQRILLREVARVLKPGGTMYLATKNRYALRLLLGGPDEHAHEMPFGFALPNWIMHRLLKRRGHDEPGGTLHSYGKLKSMIDDAGMRTTQSFWAVPEMRFPRAYVATDAGAIRKARRTIEGPLGESRRTSVALSFVPSGLVKLVSPGLVFLAVK
jgi:SAM-dependent methyltransferase